MRDKSILINNIYHMLSYALPSLRPAGMEKVSAQRFDNIHDLFAAMLVQGIRRQIKRGLYRGYANRHESLPTVRGKIDVQGTMRDRLAQRQRVSCEFDELCENNVLNQIIKTAATILLYQSDTSDTYRRALKQIMPFFDHVNTIDPSNIRWSSLPLHRNNHTYRALLGICQLLFAGLLPTEHAGTYRLQSFLGDRQMHYIYEKFLLGYYRKEHPELVVSAAHIPWAVDDGLTTMLPAMRSDVMLENAAGDTVLIIDAKYYARTMSGNYDAHTIHSANLYQMFAYVKNKAASMEPDNRTVSGMLLYARTDEEVQPDNSYLMQGDMISVRTLDLNRKFPHIAAQLDAIVAQHFGKAAA